MCAGPKGLSSDKIATLDCNGCLHVLGPGGGSYNLDCNTAERIEKGECPYRLFKCRQQPCPNLTALNNREHPLYDALVSTVIGWTLPPVPDLTIADLTTYCEETNADPAPAPISIEQPAVEPADVPATFPIVTPTPAGLSTESTAGPSIVAPAPIDPALAALFESLRNSPRFPTSPVPVPSTGPTPAVSAPSATPSALVIPVVRSAQPAQEPTYAQVVAMSTLTPQQIMEALSHITTSLGTLTTQVGRLTEARAQEKECSTVQPPKDYDGKDMEAACMFVSAFRVWARSQGSWFAKVINSTVVRDDRGVIVHNMDKIIPSVLSFLKEGPAAEWARPYIDRLAQGEDSFTSLTEFTDAFLERFAPVNATMHAFTKLQQLK